MMYVEMTVEEAMKTCGKNAKVLVAIQNLENDNDEDIIFVRRKKEEYKDLFDDIKTAASFYDDFVKQLRLFTVKQDIYNIRPEGIQKIILLRE